MATQTTGGGSATSFTNTPQANDDSYAFLEDLLRANSTLYNIATSTLLLDVMSNDLGGNAKSLFSVEDGDGNPITSDFDLLAKDVNAAGCSPWELTLNGNWVRINNGKIEYRIADGSGIPGQGVDINSLTAGQIFTDEFVYAIRLGNGTLSEATVKISITGANDNVTIGGNNAGAINEDGVPSSVSGTLTISDADAGENALQPIAAGTAGDSGYGTFQVLANGQWTYTLTNSDPDVQALAQGQVVYDTITVTSVDGTDTEVITVTITGTNDGPVANLDSGSAGENESKAFDVVANDTDVDDGAVLTLFSIDGVTVDGVAASAAEAGTFSMVGGKVQFAPGSAFDHLAAGATASVVVSYTVKDEHGASASSTLTLTVTGTNDGPVANLDTGSAGENESKAFDVVANDTDVDDGAVLTLFSIDGVMVDGVAASAAEAGTFSIVGGKIQFTPGSAFDHLAAGATASVVVSYTVKDEHGASASSTLTVTVTGTNDGPVAVDDSGAGNEDTSIAGSVAANDSDPDDGAVLSYAINGAAPAGFSMDGAGNWTLDATNVAYQHLAAGATTVVTVGYTVSDGLGGSDIGELKITVTGVNDNPALTGTQATLAAGTEDQSYIVSKASLLTGFSDVDDGTVLGVLGLSADHGSVIDNGDGTYTITPAANYNGLVTLSYSVIDGQGGSAAATLSFNLAAVNDAAVIAGPIAGIVVEATPSDPGVPSATGTLTAADVDNPPNVFIAQGSAVTASGYGSFTMTAGGVWTYTLNNANATVNALMTGMFLVDSFTVQSADGTTQTITVTINGATDAIVVTPPATFNGTGDANDFDSLVGTGVVNNGATISGENSLDDNITGGTASQNIDGKGGNDSIYAGGGADSVTGNNGDDLLYGQAGDDDINGNNGLDSIYGGSGIDTIVGGNDADTIYGGSGADIIDGSGGNDIIIGGYGADNLTGGSNDDTFAYLDLKDTNDTILDFMDAGNDQIDLSALDANSAVALDQVFGWGGNTPTANSLWFSESGGNTTLYGDTDGNVATAEFMILLPGFTGFNAYSDPLTPPPDITF